MYVFITGAAGFLGSSLAKQLVAHGHQVVGVDALHRHEAWRLGDLKLDYIWKNVEDIQPADLKDITHVIHCAASTDVPHTAASPRNAVNQSLHGTVALFEAVKRAAVPVQRVAVISSYSAYGRVAVPPEGITENVPLRPTTLYGAMKAAQEAIAFAYWQSDGIPAVCIRLATLFGINSRATLPVMLFMGKALRNEPITLTGDGTQTRDQNFISNAVNGIIGSLVGDAAGIIGQAFNIGSGREIAMLTLVQKCIEAVRAAGLDTKSEISFLPPRFGEEGRLFLDNTNAHTVFGYAPTVPLEAGLKTTAEWLVRKER